LLPARRFVSTWVPFPRAEALAGDDKFFSSYTSRR
jgi:hypothetical protein